MSFTAMSRSISSIHEDAVMEQEDKEDYLEVDPPIPGQNYVCLSFVSPEDTIKKRALFEARQYISSVLAAVASGGQTLEQAQASLTMDAYLDYAMAHDSANEALFNAQNDFKTSVRGVKVRGSFDTLKEAQRKAKVLQTRDPTFNVFVGAMGYWLPWDPNPDKVENQEFANQQLNEIVKKYKENKESKDEIWEQDLRKRIAMTKADGLAGAAAEAEAEAAKATTAAEDEPGQSVMQVEFAENLRLAELGDAAAQFRVAFAFHEGLGTPKNLKIAATWFERSSRQGYGAAQGFCALYDEPIKVIGGEGDTGAKGDTGNSSRAIFEESEDLFLSRKQKEQLTSYVASASS